MQPNCVSCIFVDLHHVNQSLGKVTNFAIKQHMTEWTPYIATIGVAHSPCIIGCPSRSGSFACEIWHYLGGTALPNFKLFNLAKIGQSAAMKIRNAAHLFF